MECQHDTTVLNSKKEVMFGFILKLSSQKKMRLENDVKVDDSRKKLRRQIVCTEKKRRRSNGTRLRMLERTKKEIQRNKRGLEM